MIGIIYIQDIKNCPFLTKYTDEYKKNNIKFKVIYWNRNNKNRKGVYRYGNFVEYADYQDVSIKKSKKMYGFIKYKIFLNREIEDCDKLVFLTTLSAFLLLDKIYKYKYIFDFRDPSFESNYIFKLIIEKIISHSFFTCISSIAFKQILPLEDYLLAHNFRYEDIEQAKFDKIKFNKKSYGSKLTITYIGAIREYEHIKKQMILFSKNPRFEVYYYGNGSDFDAIKKYVDNCNFKNIHLMGEYDNCDKHIFLKEADIINNHYPMTNNYNICTSNKFYDSIIYKRPLLSNLGCIDDIESKKYGFGIALKLEDDKDLNYLYNWYFELNEKIFEENCDLALNDILIADRIYLKKLIEFANYGKEYNND